MFGTWRLDHRGSNTTKGNPTFLRDNLRDQKACDTCRAKKLKCTGEVSGCERCANLGVQCTYLAGSAHKVRERRRRLSGKSSTSPVAKRQKSSPPCSPSLVLDSESDKDNNSPAQDEPPLNTIFPLPEDVNDSGELYDGFDTFGAMLGESEDEIFSLFTDLDSTLAGDTPFEPLTPLTPFSVASPAFAEPSRTVTGDGGKETCQCLQHVVFVLNELEVMLNEYQGPGTCRGGVEFTSGAGPLDSALGLHKKALRHGDAMRKCERCFSRAENKILLSLLVKRLVALCTYMVSVSSAERLQVYENLCSTLSVKIMAGGYDVDTGQETGAVFRELVAFQLSNLHLLLKSLAGLDQPLGTEFETTRNRVCGLLWRLRQDSLLSVFESTALSQGV